MSINDLNALKEYLTLLPFGKPYFILITGASGAGKTTLLKALGQVLLKDSISINYFDSIGIPSVKEMVAAYGSGEKWQQAMIDQWIQRLVKIKGKKLIFLEGSINPEFIRDAFAKVGEKQYFIICLQATKEIREHRLIFLRNQPDLANPNMDNWADYLKKKTLALKGEIIETDDKNIQVVLDKLLKAILKKLQNN